MADDKGDKRIGNDFWKQRTKHGRDKLFETPEILLEAACEYFQWCLDNPLMETIIQGNKKWEVPKMRAMTESGLCIFLDIERQTLDNYSNKESYKDFFAVITRIKDIIRTQKFEGASAGFLNANIIARDLGLSDKQELTGKDGSPIQLQGTWIPPSTPPKSSE